jgi:hypothetical protein
MSARRVLLSVAGTAAVLALAACGGDDGGGVGNEPAPGGLPAELQECLEEEGLDTSGGIPHGPELHEYLDACGQYLPGGTPPGAPDSR